MDFTLNPNGYVCYYRVSTKGQAKNKSDGSPWYIYQQSSCRDFLAKNDAMILDEFYEVASGTKEFYRPEFAEAVDLCIKSGATLLSTRIDRITRSLKTFKALELFGVKVYAVDMAYREVKTKLYQPLENAAISIYNDVSTVECIKTLKTVMGPVFDDLILPESCDEEFLSC